MKKKLIGLVVCCLIMAALASAACFAETVTIDNIQADVSAPVVGEYPLSDDAWLHGLDGVDVATQKWYKLGKSSTPTEMESDEAFESGKSYRCELTLQAHAWSDPQYAFAEENNLTATINDNAATIDRTSDTQITLTADFTPTDPVKVTGPLKYSISGYATGNTISSIAVEKAADNIGVFWDTDMFSLASKGSSYKNITEYAYNDTDVISSSGVYYLAIKLSAVYGYDVSGLNASDITLSTGTETLTATAIYDTESRFIRVAVFKLPLFGTEIESIKITLPVPEEGKTLSFEPTYTVEPSGGATACADSEYTWYYINKYWYINAQGERDWNTLKKTDTQNPVGSDKFYYFEMYFTPVEGYVITEDTDITINDAATDNIFSHKGANGEVYAGIFCSPSFDVTTVDIPFVKKVEQKGNTAPGTKSFTLAIVGINGKEADDIAFKDVNCSAVITTDGDGEYNGIMRLTGSKTTIETMLGTGIFVAEQTDHDKGWGYSDAVWYICRDANSEKQNAILIYPATAKKGKDSSSYEANLDKPAERMEFVNTYTLNTDSPTGTSPGMDDGSSIAVWSVLALMGAIGAALLLAKKKKTR